MKYYHKLQNITHNQIIAVVQSYENSYLLDLFESGKLSVDVIKRLIESMTSEQKSYLADNLELSIRDKLNSIFDTIKSLKGRRSIKYYKKCFDYVHTQLLSELKSLFNGWVTEEKYQELLKVTYFYGEAGFITKLGEKVRKNVAGFNNGKRTLINVDIVENFDDIGVDRAIMLFDFIVHESIHHISAAFERSGFFLYSTEVYRGINEACTEYFAELVRKENSYQQLGEVICGFHGTVQQLSRLIDAGIFDVKELAENYINGNVDYLRNSLLKYVDETTYNRIIQCFYDGIDSVDMTLRQNALTELDQLITDLIIKSSIDMINSGLELYDILNSIGNKSKRDVFQYLINNCDSEQ